MEKEITSVIWAILHAHLRHFFFHQREADDHIESLMMEPSEFLKKAIRAREADCEDACLSHFDNLCMTREENRHLQLLLDRLGKEKNIYLLKEWQQVVRHIANDLLI